MKNNRKEDYENLIRDLVAEAVKPDVDLDRMAKIEESIFACVKQFETELTELKAKIAGAPLVWVAFDGDRLIDASPINPQIFDPQHGVMIEYFKARVLHVSESKDQE